MTSIPFFNLTRATFRRAELGFFGVIVKTRVQVPDAWGHPLSAGDFVFDCGAWRQFRTNWLIVGNDLLPLVLNNPETEPPLTKQREMIPRETGNVKKFFLVR